MFGSYARRIIPEINIVLGFIANPIYEKLGYRICPRLVGWD
jgi:hypothetical protein